MTDMTPLTPEEARLRPTYAVVDLGRLRDNLLAVKRARRLASG